jgi:hypothetical protein
MRKQVVHVSYVCGLKGVTGVISVGELKPEVFLMWVSKCCSVTKEGNNGMRSCLFYSTKFFETVLPRDKFIGEGRK